MKVSGERSESDTPCVGVCSTTNLGDDVCRGCGRTAREVVEWNSYTVEQKIEINKKLGNYN